MFGYLIVRIYIVFIFFLSIFYFISWSYWLQKIDAETDSKELTNSTQEYEELDYAAKFKSGLQRIIHEYRADPVIKRGKNLPIILLDDLRRAAIRNDVGALDALLEAGMTNISNRLCFCSLSHRDSPC